MGSDEKKRIFDDDNSFITEENVDEETRVQFFDTDIDAEDFAAAVDDGQSSSEVQEIENDVSDEADTEEPAIRVKKMQMHYKMWHRLGFIAAALQLVLSIIFVVNIIRLDVLPETYLVLLFAGLAVLIALTVCAQIPKKSKISISGMGFGCIISIALLVGCIYLGRTHVVLESVTLEEEEPSYKVDSIVIAVLEDDYAQSMDDALLYNFGIQKTIDRENTNTVIAEIEASTGFSLSITEYEDFSSMVRALRRGEIQAVIYNSAFNDTIEEKEENFTDKIRVLNSHEIRSSIHLTNSDMNVTQEPFTVYISGIDVYGDIEISSRSDVNMLVTVNPVTKKIAMISTPRDYWVYLPGVSGNYRDKLTHAGIYGIQCSIDTLTQLYGIQIDYYARVNFTTLRNLVDALGGINVYSEYEFTTHYKNGGYDIKQGYNEMNGKVALAFARERYNVPGGDEQRGRDQQAVLRALLEKAMSPSILTGYMGIIDSIEGNFETNMSMNQIASLVKMQLGDGASWDMETQNATGATGMEACYSSGYQRLSVMYENFDSIVKARDLMLETGAKAAEGSEERFGGDLSQNVEFDSSLGSFASSPTVQGEDGLIPGFNYYKQAQ